MANDNRGNSAICLRCNTNEVEAEGIDSIFRLNCNECAIYKTENLREKWIGRTKAALHPCHHCRTSYELEQPLVLHQCQREQIFPCTECGQHLYSEEDLMNHTNYVHIKKSKIEKCELCGKNVVYPGEHVCAQRECPESTFSRKAQPREVDNKKRSEKSKQCEYCSKKYSYTSELKVHLRTHTGEKPYHCKICEKNFFQLCNLKVHLRTHTGEKPFQCEICEKKFSQIGHLKIHLRMHTGEKPFQCKICGRKFSRSSHFKPHLLTHTGKLPYPCKICEKTYSTSSLLKRHLLTHTGEKPFQCEICGKTFPLYFQLKEHNQTHTGERPFQCEICDKTFLRSNDLNRHLGQKK